MSFTFLTPAMGARSRTSRTPHFFSIHLLAGLVLAGCSSDAAPPTSPLSNPPRTEGPTTSGSYQSLATILKELDHVAAVAPPTSIMRSSLEVDGRTREWTGIDSIRSVLSRAAPSAQVGQTTRHESFAIPADGTDSLRIVQPMSILLTEPSRFRFLSYTSINKQSMARFTFSGSRSVSAVFGGSSMPVWTDQGTRTASEADGDAFVEWPDFQLSSGCEFSATMSTRHQAMWPWGFIIPGFVPISAPEMSTGASGSLKRDCSGAPAPPPAPPEPASPCLDPDLVGCEEHGGGSGGSSNTVLRELGRSIGSKVVCWVTDWYENGVYVDTTVHSCWIELIF